MPEKATYTSLPRRGLIHVEGPDRREFLQNLITNDLKFLKPGQALYACLLTPQGKFLHDFFVSEGESFVLLECEGGTRAQDLYKRLNAYRLRADVKISVEENIPVYAVLPPLIPPVSGGVWEGAYPDPRHPNMGWRSFEKPDLQEQPLEFWDRQRIKLCIPDGSRDMIPEQSTLDEAHIEKLNGVSYEKGCYVGQELTARMHYRGLGKKHLYAIEGALSEPGAEIKSEGKTIGEMRSNCGDMGLALLKDDSLNKLQAINLAILSSLRQ